MSGNNGTPKDERKAHPELEADFDVLEAIAEVIIKSALHLDVNLTEKRKKDTPIAVLLGGMVANAVLQMEVRFGLPQRGALSLFLFGFIDFLLTSEEVEYQSLLELMVELTEAVKKVDNEGRKRARGQP